MRFRFRTPQNSKEIVLLHESLHRVPRKQVVFYDVTFVRRSSERLGLNKRSEFIGCTRRR